MSADLCYICDRPRAEPSRTCLAKHGDELKQVGPPAVEPAPLSSGVVLRVELPQGVYFRAKDRAAANKESMDDIVRRALLYEVGDPDANGRASVIFRSVGNLLLGTHSCPSYAMLQASVPFYFKPLQFVCDEEGVDLQGLFVGNKLQLPWYSSPGKPLPSEHFASYAIGSKVQTYAYDTAGPGIPLYLNVLNKGIQRPFMATLLGKRCPEDGGASK